MTNIPFPSFNLVAIFGNAHACNKRRPQYPGEDYQLTVILYTLCEYNAFVKKRGRPHLYQRNRKPQERAACTPNQCPPGSHARLPQEAETGRNTSVNPCEGAGFGDITCRVS